MRNVVSRNYLPRAVLPSCCTFPCVRDRHNLLTFYILNKSNIKKFLKIFDIYNRACLVMEMSTFDSCFSIKFCNSSIHSSDYPQYQPKQMNRNVQHVNVLPMEGSGTFALMTTPNSLDGSNTTAGIDPLVFMENNPFFRLLEPRDTNKDIDLDGSRLLNGDMDMESMNNWEMTQDTQDETSPMDTAELMITPRTNNESVLLENRSTNLLPVQGAAMDESHQAANQNEQEQEAIGNSFTSGESVHHFTNEASLSTTTATTTTTTTTTTTVSPSGVQKKALTKASQNLSEESETVSTILKIANDLLMIDTFSLSMKKKEKKKRPAANRVPAINNEQKMISVERHANDVLCERGSRANNHPGNKRYLEEVANMCDRYRSSDKKTKSEMARQVLKYVHVDLGGRFIMEVRQKWLVITDNAAISKVKQALREYKTPEEREAKKQRTE